MKSTELNNSESLFRKLMIPFLLSVLLGLAIFYSSAANKVMGLEALQDSIIVVGYGLSIAEILIISVLFRRIIQYFILDQLIATALGTPTPRLLSQMVTVITYTLAIAAIVAIVFKKDLTVFLATFGGASIVVGLALQSMIQDLFAGLTINLDRSINIGDFIRLDNGDNEMIEGRILEIQWRSLQLIDSKGNMVIVPNNQVYTQSITNYSRPETFYKIDLPIFLNTEVPIDQALRILNTAALEASPKFSPADAPMPSVRINQITLDGVEYFIHIYPTFATRDNARDLVQQNVLRYLNYANLTPALEKIGERTPATVINKMQHIANLLGTTDIFQDLSAPDLDLLANVTQLRSLSAGVLVVQGGEIANSVFFVIEGLLVLEDWRKKDTKNLVTKFIIGPGTLINATTFIAGGICESNIRTKSMVLLCEISYSAVEQLFLQNPQSGSYLSRRVAERLSNNCAENNAGFKQPNIESNIDELYEKVFKNLRRLFAHLKLIDIVSNNR
ncbi:MAG: hypothetical protein RLZ75_2671 [Pseudomonadota bacterium]